MSIPLLVDLWLAKRAVHTFCRYRKEDINILAWNEYLEGEYSKTLKIIKRRPSADNLINLFINQSLGEENKKAALLMNEIF